MASVDATSFDAVLKEYYTDEAVRDLTYEENPLHAMLPKKQVDGRRYIQPVQYAIPPGRSRTFTDAQSNKGTNKYEDFLVTYADDFGEISITRKIMKQSGSDSGAFFEARTREIDGMLKKLIRNCAISEYRNEGGAKGQVGSISTTVLTLKDVEDVTNFEIGDEVESAETDGTSGSLQSGTATITAIDRDAGTLTTDSNWTTQIATLDADDYLFIEGDFGASIAGLEGWIPRTAPTSGDSFFSVDRSVDVTRLAGSRVDGSNVPVYEAIRNGIARLGREGASPDCVFMSHAKYRDLELELDNKVRYDKTKAEGANVFFKTISIAGNNRTVSVYADQNCQNDICWLLTKDTWKLISLGPVPDLVNDDGVTMLRETSSAAYAVRADFYGNMVCEDPRANALITLE